jgi:hypothetical protein
MMKRTISFEHFSAFLKLDISGDQSEEIGRWRCWHRFANIHIEVLNGRFVENRRIVKNKSGGLAALLFYIDINKR